MIDTGVVKMDGQWVKDFPAAITVCDTNGIITEMNRKSRLMFEKDGGGELLGKNLMDCHPPKAQQQIEQMLQEQKPNYYITEKKGKKKLVIQSPCYDGTAFTGLVEMVFELPGDLPVAHHD